MDFTSMNVGSVASVVAVSAILGTVAGFVVKGWVSIKSFFKACSSLFVSEIHLEDEATCRAIISYLVKNKKRSKFGARTFGGKYENFRNGKYGHIPFEFFGGKRVFFWHRWFPLVYNVVIEKENDKKGGGGVIYWGNKPKEDVKASLIYLRGTIDVEKIIKEASEEYNEIHWKNNLGANRRFFIKKIPDASLSGESKHCVDYKVAWFYEGIYKLLSHTPNDLGQQQETQGKATQNLYFPDYIYKLINEIKVWRSRKNWYVERGIPWKRGWLLYGPPGTGKSAIARAIAEELDLPLFVYSLGEVTNDELTKSWKNMQSHTPCVALFEDFDNVFHGRENVYGKPKISDLITANNPNAPKSDGDSSSLTTGRLSFDCLLNCIDGVDKSGGVFTIITTNYIEKIDPALGVPDSKGSSVSTRPGRIDKVVELSYMQKEDKVKLAKRIFFDDPVNLKIMIEMIESSDLKETPAQFQEKCAQMALESLWSNENIEEFETKLIKDNIPVPTMKPREKKSKMSRFLRRTKIRMVGR